MGVAILGTSGLAFGLGGTMLFDGNGGGFEIDSVGTLYSGDGSDSGIANGDDWAQNPNDATFKGVLDDNGDAAFGFNAKRSVDQNWGNQGDGSDASKFNGGSNKNDDLIGAGEEPWMWDGTGGGPQKNDITNTYFHTRVDGNGDRWVIVGAETRSTHGDSHVDFEFLQAGMEVTGGTFDSEGNIIGGAGLLIGQGPAGGRTIDDFSVSVDFLQGGVTPIATVRTWEGANYSAPMDPSSFPNAIFSSTNLGDICHDADGAFPCGASPGTWTHFVSNGGQTSVLGEFQLVEAAINLTELGIDVDVCSTAATFIVKSRSSQSFTAELKDFRLVPFPLEPTPECVVNGPDSVCPGTQDISYTANETTGLSGVTFEWEIMGDATFDDGSNMATGETVTVDADQVCDGSFELWVTVATEFCDNTCHTSVTVDDDEAPTITCPPDVTLECPANTTPGNTGTATCSDNCNCSVSFSDSVAPGCGNTEVITRTWTAEDECGNFNSCDQIITVVDTTAPTITCPPDVTLECPADTSPNNTGTATCSDTCGGCTVSFSDSSAPGCGNTETITRTWTATDDCDNTATCVQIITVVDTTAPVITSCPSDASIDCETPFTFNVEASDDCGDVTVSCSFTADNPGAVSLVDLGGGRFTITISDTATAVVTCVATDECGNDSAECTFVVSAVCVGEGCTPGFWRQPQHFGHWPAPYTPGTLFSAVFENAFPGKTLLDVVSLGGGGLKALGRHTVAALLNAASGGVDYPLSAADVIAAFNDVFPGSNQEYNALKDLFVELNEAGCPLGGFRGVDDSADSADSADDQNASDPSGKQPAAGDQGTAPAENSVESPSTTMHVVGEGIDVKVVVEDSTEDPAAIEPGRLVGIVINDGLLEPGRFGGSFEVVGNYLQKPEGRLHVELGGIEPIEGYDVLLVHFDAVLHGTLTVSLVDGFVPKAGDTFRVIRAAQVFGEFDTVEMPDLIDVVLTATYDEIGMVLTAAVKPLVGDLNGDGVVDANDLVLLVLDWDQSGSKADLDADGTVGIGDIAAMFMAE